jgi:predicted secreted protein
MSIGYVVFIYVLVWWTLLFAVLPLGVERHAEEGKGYDAGAPAKPDMKRKIVLTSVLSAVFVAVIYVLAEMDVINMQRIFEG